jgi:hypothetical protein
MKRSPLKAKPLRVAGQSLDEAIEALPTGIAGTAAVVLTLFPALAAWEWIRWYPELKATAVRRAC